MIYVYVSDQFTSDLMAVFCLEFSRDADQGKLSKFLMFQATIESYNWEKWEEFTLELSSKQL